MSNTRTPAPPYFRLLPPPTPGSAAYSSREVCAACGVGDGVASATAVEAAAISRPVRRITLPPSTSADVTRTAGGLQLVQLGIESAGREQRVVRAALHDLRVVDDENRI